MCENARDIEIEGRPMRWTREMAVKVIECYEKHPFLWNASLPKYQNTSLKQQVIKTLAKEFGCSARRVILKWHTLKTTFYQKLEIVNRMKRLGNTNYIPKWAHYQRMLFLTEGHLDTPLQLEDASEMVTGNGDNVGYHSSKILGNVGGMLGQSRRIIKKIPITITLQLEQQLPSSEINSSISNVSVGKGDCQEVYARSVDQTVTSAVLEQKFPEYEFGKFVADSVATLSPDKRDYAKLKIKELIQIVAHEDFVPSDDIVIAL